ncbi:MAG: DMT family transporter [Paracoccaceae bacterium]
MRPDDDAHGDQAPPAPPADGPVPGTPTPGALAPAVLPAGGPAPSEPPPSDATPQASTLGGDRPFLGILLMLAFCVMAPMGDAIAKHVGASVTLATMIVVRFAIQPVVLAAFAWREVARMGRRAWALTALRTALHVTGLALMFLSLRHLPLADAIAIAFVMPFILLLLGHLWLGEEVGPVRLAACGLGFVGTLLVLRPNLAEAGAVALLPLGVAVVFALFMLVTRQVAPMVGALALQTASGALASAVLIPAALLSAPLWAEARLHVPDASTAGWLLAMGLLGTVAHLAMTGSLRFAPASTLAPMQYLEIPVATVIGYLAFADLPGGTAALGIAVTVGAGLWIVERERRLARHRPG